MVEHEKFFLAKNNEEFPSLAHKMFYLFFAFELQAQREKEFSHRTLLFVNIFFFHFSSPWGQPWRWFIYDSRVFSLGSTICHQMKRFYFCARVENLLQRFFVSFRCLWFRMRLSPLPVDLFTAVFAFFILQANEFDNENGREKNY